MFPEFILDNYSADFHVGNLLEPLCHNLNNKFKFMSNNC